MPWCYFSWDYKNNRLAISFYINLSQSKTPHLGSLLSLKVLLKPMSKIALLIQDWFKERLGSSQTANEKYSKNKDFIYLLPSTFFYGVRWKSKYNYINIKTTHPISFTFSQIPFFQFSCVHLFCVLYFVNWTVYSTGIFVGLSSWGPPCNFAEWLFFLHSCNPVDAGGKLNVHKRRPGQLLNCLCTFNLRPVSTGEWLLPII